MNVWLFTCSNLQGLTFYTGWINLIYVEPDLNSQYKHAGAHFTLSLEQSSFGRIEIHQFTVETWYSNLL